MAGGLQECSMAEPPQDCSCLKSALLGLPLSAEGFVADLLQVRRQVHPMGIRY